MNELVEQEDGEIRACLAKAFGIGREPRYKKGSILEIQDIFKDMKFDKRLTQEEFDRLTEPVG